jgi:hypothetical protein
MASESGAWRGPETVLQGVSWVVDVLPTVAYKKGVKILFLYVTVSMCQKAIKPLQSLIEFAFLRVK